MTQIGHPATSYNGENAYLVFSRVTMMEMVDQYIGEEKDAELTFWMSGGDHNVFIVTDMCQTEDEARNRVDPDNRFDHYHGMSQQNMRFWAMNVSDLMKSVAKPDAARIALARFGQKTIPEFNAFMQEVVDGQEQMKKKSRLFGHTGG